jgi:hypothetical protein
MRLPHASDPSVRRWSAPTQPEADRGTLFATHEARGATALWFDREQRDHAVTVFAGVTGDEVMFEGLRWTVRWDRRGELT